MSCLLNWRKPTYNGGAEIEGYIIESQAKGDYDWKLVNQTSAFTTNYRAVNLKKNGKKCFFCEEMSQSVELTQQRI